MERSHLETQIHQQESVIDDFSKKLEQTQEELLSTQELLKAEMLKVKDQSSLVSKLSNTIEERDEELIFLNSLVSKGQLAELTAKVNDLTEQLATQTEVLKASTEEGTLKSNTITTLEEENQSIKQRISDLSKILEESNSLGEKMSAENKVLNMQLEEEYKKCVSLIREKSGITLEKLAVSRKLDEANSKVMLLELQLKKQTAAEEVAAVQETAASQGVAPGQATTTGQQNLAGREEASAREPVAGPEEAATQEMSAEQMLAAMRAAASAS